MNTSCNKSPVQKFRGFTIAYAPDGFTCPFLPGWASRRARIRHAIDRDFIKSTPYISKRSCTSPCTKILSSRIGALTGAPRSMRFQKSGVVLRGHLSGSGAHFNSQLIKSKSSVLSFVNRHVYSDPLRFCRLLKGQSNNRKILWKPSLLDREYNV